MSDSSANSMDIVFLGIFYKLSRRYLCLGVDREYLPPERLCTHLCQESRIMTRDHIINFSDWNILAHSGSNKCTPQISMRV